MTTAIPREELEARYQRARQRVFHQRKELRHLNKALLHQQMMWRDAFRQVEHWRQRHWEATKGAGYKYGFTPPPVYVRKIAWLPVLVGWALGLAVGYFVMR